MVTLSIAWDKQKSIFLNLRGKTGPSSIRSDKMHAPSMTNKSPSFPVVILLLSVDLCTKCFFKWWQAAPMVSWDMVLSAIACHLRSSPPAHPSQPQNEAKLVPGTQCSYNSVDSQSSTITSNNSTKLLHASVASSRRSTQGKCWKLLVASLKPVITMSTKHPLSSPLHFQYYEVVRMQILNWECRWYWTDKTTSPTLQIKYCCTFFLQQNIRANFFCSWTDLRRWLLNLSNTLLELNLSNHIMFECLHTFSSLAISKFARWNPNKVNMD